jgi:anti-sigma B factor antagonist
MNSMPEPTATEPSMQPSAGALYPHLSLFSRLDKESQLKLNLEIYANEDVIVVTCTGRVVYGYEAATLSGRVAEILPRARLIVLELSQVEIIDGAGLGELVILLRLARRSGCSMKLAAPSQRVREMLELTNLHTVFEIHSTLDEAMLSSRGQVA